MWINLQLVFCMVLKQPSSSGPHYCVDNQEFIWMANMTWKQLCCNVVNVWSFLSIGIESHGCGIIDIWYLN